MRLKRLTSWLVGLALILSVSIADATSLLPYPKFKAQTTTGVVLSGGKVYTYEPGTTTMKATYKDSTKLVVNTNPVILDTRGEAVIYLDGFYDIVLKNSANVSQWTMAGVNGMNVTYPTYEVDALNDYGQGSVYTQATINAALTAIGSTESTLLLRPGTWVIASNITVPSNIALSLPKGTTITPTSGVTFAVNGPIIASAEQIFDQTGGGTVTVSTYPQNQAWWGKTQRSDFYGGGLVPIGGTIIWHTETCPTNFVPANGASLVRTGTYANLFAVISTLYGAADSTHFNVPNFKGMFIRGWADSSGNDPDRATRTANAATGATMTAGDHVGTEQATQNLSHNHTASSSGSSEAAGAHTHSFKYHYDAGSSSLVVQYGNSLGVASNSTGSAGSHSHSISVSTTNTATGGNQSNPINVNVQFCIRY
jgi:microcystin-dependent protein